MKGIKLTVDHIESIFKHWDIDGFKFKRTGEGCMFGDDEETFHLFNDGSHHGHVFIYKAFLQAIIESINSYCNNQNTINRYYIEQPCNKTVVYHTNDNTRRLWENMMILEQKQNAIIYILGKME